MTVSRLGLAMMLVLSFLLGAGASYLWQRPAVVCNVLNCTALFPNWFPDQSRKHPSPPGKRNGVAAQFPQIPYFRVGPGYGLYQFGVPFGLPDHRRAFAAVTCVTNEARDTQFSGRRQTVTCSETLTAQGRDGRVEPIEPRRVFVGRKEDFVIGANSDICGRVALNIDISRRAVHRRATSPVPQGCPGASLQYDLY